LGSEVAKRRSGVELKGGVIKMMMPHNDDVMMLSRVMMMIPI